MCLFKTIQVERRITSHVSLNHLSGKEITVIGGMVTEKQFYFSSLLNNNKYPAVHHKVNVRAQDIYHLYSSINYYIPRHIYNQTVLCKHSIKSSYCILTGLGELRVVFCY